MPADLVPDPDRRGIDRRVDLLERELRQLETQVAVMQATLNGLVSTMDSRHTAFERGQDLILKGIDALEKAQAKQDNDLKLLAAAPQDLSKLAFSPGVVVAIVTAILSIVAGQMASTWGMRSDIRDIGTRINAQTDLDQTAQKLQEERSNTLKAAVDTLGRRQELNQIQLQELRDEVRGRARAAQ